MSTFDMEVEHFYQLSTFLPPLYHLLLILVGHLLCKSTGGFVSVNQQGVSSKVAGLTPLVMSNKGDSI